MIRFILIVLLLPALAYSYESTYGPNNYYSDYSSNTAAGLACKNQLGYNCQNDSVPAPDTTYCYLEYHNNSNNNDYKGTQYNVCFTGGDPTTWYGDVTVTGIYYYTAAGCPNGGTSDPVTHECGTVPDCSETLVEGDVWNSTTESCECPVGTADTLDPNGSYECRPTPTECEPGQPHYRGTANGYPVCDWDTYCDQGQSGGYFNGEWVCVDDSNCGPGETYVNGVCVGPDDTNDNPNPDSDPSPNDTDNDGIPDSSDPDDDNDGIPDAEDPTPQGEGVARSGRSSSDCNIPPACDGDPINCAILHQEWQSMCAGNEALESLSTMDSDAAATLAGQGMTDLDSYGEGALLDQIGVAETDLQTEFGTFLDAPGNTAACPDPVSIDMGRFGVADLQFTWFCDLADILRYIVLLAAYFIGGQIVLRSVTA